MKKYGELSELELHDFVERYEAARESSRVIDLADFLPPPDHPEFADIVTELIRVDLENQEWPSTGDSQSRIAEYRRRFSDVLSSPSQLQKVAFEEYRLRRLAGEHASRDEYQRRFSIPVDTWPELPVGERAATTAKVSAEDSWYAELSRTDPTTARRLAQAVHQLPRAGEMFLNFELTAELGQGTFGRVFLARQGDLSHRFVALKITAHLSDEPQTLAQLQHTNIMPIYSVHQRGDLLAVCMPFLGSNTLADVLKTFQIKHTIPDSGAALMSAIAAGRTVPAVAAKGQEPECEGRAPEGEASRDDGVAKKVASMSYINAAAWIVAALADGLAHAHERGVVHRDLKPENILLSDDGQPLLLDFNLATRNPPHGISTTMVGGTLPYMAPEHLEAVRENGRVDVQSDIYSLGVILYEMVTGRHPYPVRRGLFEDVTRRMLDDRLKPAPSARIFNHSLTADVDSILGRCLALDPADRYTSARQLQEDLQRHIDNRPLRHARNRSLAERMRKWLRRHPLFTSNAAITAAGVIAVLTIGSLWFVRGHQLAQHQARELLRGLQTRLGDARATLNTPWIDEATLVGAVDAAETTLHNCRLLESNDLARSGILTLLSPMEHRQLCQDAGELLYLLAGAKGQQAMHSDRPPDRQRLLDEALQLNQRAQIVTANLRTERAFLLQRTRLLAAAGYTKGAEKLRQRAFAEGSDLSDKRLLAVERAAEQEYTAAVGLLEEAIRLSPQDYTLWFSLGNCHMSLQEFADAEGCFTTAIALRPNFILGYHHRGLTRLGLHDYSGARVDFDTVIGRRPDFTAALVNRALVYRGLGQPDLAIRDLTLALDRGATQTRIYFLRARLRSEVGDSEGAERDQRDGLRLQPRDELSWIARGVAKLPSAPEAALADFSEARRLNPRSRGALQNIAYTLSEILGETEQGVTVMNELVALDPTDPTALASRGVLLARLGKRAQAIADAEAALLAADNPDVIYQVGGIYALTSTHQRGDADRAVALIARSLKLKPSLVALTHHDADLHPLRGCPKYREVVTTAEALLNFSEEGGPH